MASNDIQIVAGLDIPKSKSTIDKDIPVLEKELQNDKSSRPKLIATLDINKSKKAIQANLDTLISKTDAPKIKVGIDVGGVQEVRSITTELKNIQNQAIKTAKSVHEINTQAKNFKFPVAIKEHEDGITVTDTLKTLQNARDMFSKLGFTDVSFQWADESGGVFEKLTAKVTDSYNAVQNFKFALRQSSDDFTYDGSIGNDSGVAKQVRQLEKDYAKYSKLLAEFRNKNSPIESGLTAPIREMETALLGLKNGTKTVDDVSISFNNLEQSASKISKYLETTNKSLDKKNNAVNTYRDFDKTIQQLETNVKNLTLKPAGLDKDVADVRKHISELQALEKSEGGFTENWAKRYHDVNLEVHALKSNIDLAMQAESKSQKADKHSAYQVQLKYLNAIKKENSLILRLKKQIVNAGEEEAKVLEHRVDKAYKRIQDKVKQLNKKGLYTDDAKIVYNTGVNDRNDLDELLNAKLADKATKKATADLVKYRTEVDRTIAKLNNLFNNTTFKNNSINNEVIEQKNKINGLSTEYQKIKTILQGDINPTGIKSVGAVLRNLKVEFDTAQAETDELKAKLNLSRDLNRMSKDIDILRNRIAIFRSENTKSEKMMGGTFDSLDARLVDLKSLTKENILDKQAFANISRDFRNAEKEVKKFGRSGKTVFQTLGEQAKKFSSWMSLTYIIASFARSVRRAVSELKEINTVLTEISKTSDRTSESLDRLGKASFDRASQYGRKASDYLTGVQEMSRAGFGEQESENMAELSVLAQSAGDMTSELANQYLIATNAGYKLEGNAKRLNSILDSQNFITNRNALNLSELAEATKIVSSQASQAGIGIDEMTAAVGTMIATTQQGGEVASRAFKGLVMNLQQVTGEVGDGEDDITTESLTKYEKACWDLGVALKEVKDGTLQLRDPMLVLKELATAVSKEAEGSIKTANLINAVGGKYRGGQLAALLENWSTYEKMLAEFNSDEAIGSALEESMKTAESWEGRLNAVSNSWTELINKMIQSDDAISILNTVDSLIQDMSDSKTISGLGSIADLFVKIFGAVGKVADWAGVIPTLSATFGMVSAFKGQSIFGNIIGFSKAESNYIGSVITALKDLSGVKATFKDFKIDLSGLGTPDIKSLQNYVNLIDSGEDYTVAFNKTMEDTTFAAREQAKNFEKLHIAKRKGVISTDEFTAATKNLATTQKVATATSKALSTALNLVANIGITLAISGLIKIISELNVTEQEAADKRAENIQRIQESVQKYQEEEQAISDLFDRYTELYNSTDDLNTVKQDLSQIQDELIDKFGKEAEAIDLLNGKYSENLKAQRELRKQAAEDFLSDNKKKIEQAEQRQNGKNADSIKFKVTVLNNADLEKLHQLEKETNGLFSSGGKNGYDYTFKIKETDYNTQLKIIEQYAEIISQFDYTTEETYEKVINRKNDLDDLIAKDKSIIEEAKQARDLVDTNVSAEYDRAINELKEKQKQLSDLKNNDGSLFDIQTAEQELIDIQNTALKYAGASSVLKQEVFDIINSVDFTTKDLSSSFDALKSDIKEIAGEDFENSLSQVEKIKSAMQTLASGELLEWSDASELMFDIDTERVLGDFEEIDGKYRLIGNDISSLIKLKDKLIQKQIDEIELQKQSQEEALKEAQIRLETAKLQLSRSNSASDAKYWNEQISDIESEMIRINSLTRDYNYLIGYLNSQLRDTVDHATALKERMEKVQESADKYADAMTRQVDDIIDNLQGEQDILEEQKSALEEQLDVLEEQKSELEDIIDRHKDIVDVIGEEVEREKKLLEEQRDAEEEAIQAKIDALKESKKKQEEENDLVEKEFELQKKLADLEKAKQTKVRTFSQARGWHYDVDKEAVANAQTAVTDAQKTYDDAVAEKVFSDQIEALEKQKETIGETYEEQLKAYENYYEEWKAILDEEINAENERIAVEIMGSDWREKIKKRDSGVLNSFASSFRSYNNQLKNLVSNEIANLKESIIAKEEEIKAKQKQIKVWQDYKNQVQDTIDSTKNKYDEYLQYLNDVTLNESSSYEDRANALENFKNNYSKYIEDLNNMQQQYDFFINVNTNFAEARAETLDFFLQYKEAAIKMHEIWMNSPGGFGAVNSQWDADLIDAYNAWIEFDPENIFGYYSKGGVADKTGLAMLHGTKSSAETIFNAQQSRQLYDMVRTGNFSKLVAQKAIEGLKGAKMSNLTNNNSNDRIINIQNMTIKADNPTQFHDQFMKEIGQYWRVQLAESKVK